MNGWMSYCTRSSQPASHDLGRRTPPVKSLSLNTFSEASRRSHPRASIGALVSGEYVAAHERRAPTRGMSRLLLAMVLHTHARRACAVPRIFNWEEPVKRADMEALRHAADQASELPASMGLRERLASYSARIGGLNHFRSLRLATNRSSLARAG